MTYLICALAWTDCKLSRLRLSIAVTRAQQSLDLLTTSPSINPSTTCIGTLLIQYVVGTIHPPETYSFSSTVTLCNYIALATLPSSAGSTPHLISTLHSPNFDSDTGPAVSRHSTNNPNQCYHACDSLRPPNLTTHGSHPRTKRQHANGRPPSRSSSLNLTPVSPQAVRNNSSTPLSGTEPRIIGLYFRIRIETLQTSANLQDRVKKLLGDTFLHNPEREAAKQYVCKVGLSAKRSTAKLRPKVQPTSDAFDLNLRPNS
nr:hypothetical protein Iba_chr01bCG1910 [Ipomoea batatas]